MTNPLVSIVTISFNQAEFLEFTINSIIEQDYPNIEYIIVDPGSSDGSRDIIAKYRDRIDKIILEPDFGPADGLNKGFNLALGNIFCFVNSDDILLPGAITKVVKQFIAHPTIDVLYGNGIKINQNNQVIQKVFVDKYNRNRFFYRKWSFFQPSIFFSKNAFRKVGGFNINNKTCWDKELLIDFSIQNFSFFYINEFLSCFRIHQNSNTGLGKSHPKFQLWIADENRLFTKATGHNKLFSYYIISMFYLIIKIFKNPRSLLNKVYFNLCKAL